MSDLPRIYNSRILNLFLDFIKTQYPDINSTTVYDHLKIEQYEIEDPGHWFNQEQVDSFYEMMVKVTENPAIARDAGRHIVSSSTMGAVKQYILGLLNITSIYMLMGKLYPMISRGVDIHTRKLRPNQVEITVTPKKGVNEKPYQCENRIGIFESLPKLFTDKIASVEQPFCFHKGDAFCRYIITWDQPSFLIVKRIQQYATVAGIIASSILFFQTSYTNWVLSSSFFTIVVLYFLYLSSTLEKKEMAKAIKVQGDAAGAHVKEIRYRYNSAMLVQEVGHAIADILDETELVKILMTKIEKRLDFDRGMVMLVNTDKTRLNYLAGFGYNQAVEALLKQTRFHLDKPGATGLFVKALISQKPVLIKNLRDIENTLSKRSQAFAKKIGAKMLICIPIVFKKKAFGILAVDNIRSKRPLTKSDMNLLQAVASQAAAGIDNAITFKKLMQSEEKHRNLYENAPNAYFQISLPEGTILDCNPAAEMVMGSTKDVLIGSSVFDYTLRGTINKDKIFAIYRAFKKVKAVHGIEMPIKRPDGKFLWGSLFVQPFFNNKKNAIEGLVMVVDITERRRLEKQLRNAQKMEAIGTLAGGVAHDLNNILSGLVSYPELLLLDIKSGSPLEKPLKRIKESGEKAAAVVQDLLTLARRGVSLKDPVRLCEIVSDYLKSPEYETLLSFHPHVNVEAIIPKNLPALSGSPVQLSKVVMNLVSNAFEAMPNGGTLRVEIKKQYIHYNSRLSTPLTGSCLVITVEDSGIGISSGDINRIFEPFYTRKAMGRSGTGLGMAVVWGIVEDHGGQIEVESKLGFGTKFTLYFPVTHEQVPTDKKNKESGSYTGSGETILVIDDEPGQIEIASNILKKIGYAVYTAASGEEAVEFVKSNKPDLIILDMLMEPGIDGLETYKRIVRIRPGQKALIASGYSKSSKVKEVQKLGAGKYIKKPYTIVKLAEAIRVELNKVF